MKSDKGSARIQKMDEKGENKNYQGDKNTGGALKQRGGAVTPKALPMAHTEARKKGTY